MKKIIEKIENYKIATDVYEKLNNAGAKLGNVSIHIIQNYLKENVLSDLHKSDLEKQELVDALIELEKRLKEMNNGKSQFSIRVQSQRIKNKKIIEKYKGKTWEQINAK